MSAAEKAQPGPATGQDFKIEAELLRVLAHPLRLRILAFLLECPAHVNVKRLWTSLLVPQALVSQQLSILKAHGIITGTRRGNNVHYELTHPKAVAVLKSIQQIPKTNKKRNLENVLD